MNVVRHPTLVRETLVTDLQGALRRLRGGKLAATGTDGAHDDGAREVLGFLTDRCGWKIAPVGEGQGLVVVGTGAGITRRQAVLQNAYEALEHADHLDTEHAMPAPSLAGLRADAAGVMREWLRLLEAGGPFDHQTRGVLEATVRLLEHEDE